MTEAVSPACAWIKQGVTQNKKQKETGCVALNYSSDAARLPVATQMRGYWKALILLLLLLPMTVLALPPPATIIDNPARASFDLGGPLIAVNRNTVT